MLKNLTNGSLFTSIYFGPMSEIMREIMPGSSCLEDHVHIFLVHAQDLCACAEIFCMHKILVHA